MAMILGAVGERDSDWTAWLYVVAPLLFYWACVLALLAAGRRRNANVVREFFERISDSLERITGMPGWSMAGVLSGLLVLLVAVIGLYWDVAWHIDLGRDRNLFTPAHVMILLGLGGLVYAGAVSIIFASLERAPVGPVRSGALRVPWSSIALLALGLGGLAAFPVDNLWHQAFGLDVTLWSPTHLQLIAGGGLSTIALWLMIAEALPHSRPTRLARSIHVVVAGATLVAVSTVQGEFDYGVPQFQLLYLPVLVAAAAGFALVLARIALGPGGALKATVTYLVLRLGLSLLVGGALGHTPPGFPLYLTSALAVEAAAWLLGGATGTRLALLGGALVGTAGLAGEIVWLHLLGWPAPLQLLPRVAVLAPAAAIAAAGLAVGLHRAFHPGASPSPAPALALAGAVLVAVLAVPLPRDVGRVGAVISLQRSGDEATVTVQLDPPDAAGDATLFGVGSWQGGGRVASGLREIGPGRYVSLRPVPVTGSWKSVVTLQRGDEVMAAPVYLPADPEIGAPEIPALAARRAAFVRDTDLLLRERHDGPLALGILAYTSIASVLTAAVVLFALAVRGIARQGGGGEPSRARRAPAPMARRLAG